jgi:hypothetical protein
MSVASAEQINNISLIFNVVLTVISAGLIVASWRDARSKKSQVKIWMEQANGIQQALQRIIADIFGGNYSSIKDLAAAVNALHASAFAHYQSLYDERILTEKEVKEHQMKIRKKIDEDLELGGSTGQADPNRE